MKLALAALLMLSSAAPALAQPYHSDEYQPGWSRQQRCFKRVYREEYVPGTLKSPGYVKSFKERVEVPCEEKRGVIYNYNQGYVPPRYVPSAPPRPQAKVDDNSCIEGSVLGGLAGGGIGAAASRKEGRLWAIPLGIVGGALVGCQIDGG